MIALRARMAGAPAGQIWPAPGGESAMGERQSSARGTETEGGSWIAHPTRISANGKATEHPFIAAQNSCLSQNQSSLKTPVFTATLLFPQMTNGID
jgi:hypothetical protein